MEFTPYLGAILRVILHEKKGRNTRFSVANMIRRARSWCASYPYRAICCTRSDATLALLQFHYRLSSGESHFAVRRSNLEVPSSAVPLPTVPVH